MNVLPTLDLLDNVTGVCLDGKDLVVIPVLTASLVITVMSVIPTLDLLDYVTHVFRDGAVTTVISVPEGELEKTVLRDVQWDGLVSTVMSVNLDSVQKVDVLNASTTGSGLGLSLFA